jgi:hypothetical protein
MMIRFPCPGCDTSLSAPEECAGRTSRCPKCGAPVVVPAFKEQQTVPVVIRPDDPPALASRRRRPREKVVVAWVMLLGVLVFMASALVVVAVIGFGPPPAETEASCEHYAKKYVADEDWICKESLYVRRDEKDSTLWRASGNAQLRGDRKTTMHFSMQLRFNGREWIMVWLEKDRPIVGW